MDEKMRMQVIANNITHYRKQRGITQKELAKSVGITASTMTDYMKLRSAPSFGVIQKLADFFEVKKSDIDTTFKEISNTPSPAVLKLDKDLHEPRHGKWVQYGNELLKEQKDEKKSENVIDLHEVQAEYKSDKIISMEEYRKRVPVNVDFAASAGTGVCQEDNLDMEVMFYEDELAEDYDSVGIVMGSSMEPVLKNGDYIFVKITTDIPNGAISIWQVNGENYVKKFRSNGRPYLESLNPEYDDVELDEDDNIRPLGVVVDVYRER